VSEVSGIDIFRNADPNAIFWNVFCDDIARGHRIPINSALLDICDAQKFWTFLSLDRTRRMAVLDRIGNVLQPNVCRRSHLKFSILR